MMFPGPIMPIPEMEELFVVIDELPQNIKQTFEYHPEKAKQLLAEAGYPNSFKIIKVPVFNANPPSAVI